MAGHRFACPVANAAVTDTAKSILAVKAPTNIPLVIHAIQMALDGTDSTKGPGLVEAMLCDYGGAGTATSVTLVDLGGRPETIQATGFSSYSAEPTTLSLLAAFDLPSYNGFAYIPFPREIAIIRGGYGFVLRVTMPTGVSVNFSGSIIAEE